MNPTPRIAKGPFHELFEGMPCPVQWAFDAEGTVYRNMDGRCTKRIEVDGASYFVKTYAGASLAETIKNGLSLRGPSASAAGEVLALQAAAAAGIQVPQVVAAGERGRRSFIITKDVGII